MSLGGQQTPCPDNIDSAPAHAFELGLHIAALFAILIVSAFGIIPLYMSDYRCSIPYHRKPFTATPYTVMAALRSETFRDGSHHSDSLRPCTPP
jgi:hypothetical protein